MVAEHVHVSGDGGGAVRAHGGVLVGPSPPRTPVRCRLWALRGASRPPVPRALRRTPSRVRRPFRAHLRPQAPRILAWRGALRGITFALLRFAFNKSKFLQWSLHWWHSRLLHWAFFKQSLDLWFIYKIYNLSKIQSSFLIVWVVVSVFSLCRQKYDTIQNFLLHTVAEI